ncbi:MAG: 5-oxoprolinase subunit PxpA [Gammaproteobacteria bacterium]|nr:5-oxoprolinase subunit PxpA [Gammaproteobacteria bacterium]
MKLNCDLGESFGSWKMGLDEAVMPHIDMANIACGFHAGDANVMFNTLSLAKKHNVEVGAHPGYKDIEGFGRRSIAHSEQEIINLMTYQVSAIFGVAKTLGVTISYVKPHGALYNDMMANAEVRHAILKSMQAINHGLGTSLKLMMLATANAEQHKNEAKQLGVELLLEAFADRRYTDEGKLQNRKIEGAVLSEQDMLQQVVNLQQNGQVITESGKALTIAADTICVHGDNEHGVAQIKQIRAICQP